MQATEQTPAFRPRDEKDVAEAVAWAVAEEKPLELVGHGTKRNIGRPLQCEHTLDMSALAGVTLYEPEELVISAKAGTPLAEIDQLLTENGQELAFEPVDFGPLFGAEPGRASIGGTMAANLSGPRRIRAGAARDHFLGLKAVSGRGEAFKAGGRVMKNVTGYDLTKGVAGSWGTLVAMTEVTLKVQPAAETEKTVVIIGLDAAAAAQAMAAALGSAFEVSSAAHLPALQTVGLSELGGFGHAMTALRLEGFASSVDYRADKLKALVAPFGAIEILTPCASRKLWADIRDVRPFAADGDKAVWRISTAPMAGAKMAAAIEGAEAFYDWGGGLVWLALAEGADAGAAAVWAAVATHGGHATLIRASAATRAAVAVFQPQPAPLAALAARYKAQFDPNGVLNPGRMAAGM